MKRASALVVVLVKLWKHSILHADVNGFKLVVLLPTIEQIFIISFKQESPLSVIYIYSCGSKILLFNVSGNGVVFSTEPPYFTPNQKRQKKESERETREL